MGLKFKNQNPISDNNTLKVYFCTQKISEDDIIIVYHIAATTVDEAVDLWIEKYSDITWKDKTREDFTRKDYWEAWIDHNREKTYNVYLNKISKLKRKLSKSMIEIPGIFYIGKLSPDASVVNSETVSFENKLDRELSKIYSDTTNILNSFIGN